MTALDRFVSVVERVSGIFLGLVVALTFVSVLLRFFFSVAIPDWFLFACYLQGIAIFWGIASTTYRNSHILVDLLWEMSGPRSRRWIDLFANTVSLLFIAAFAWMLYDRVLSTAAGGLATNELRLPVWPFYAVAALGIWAALALGAIRLWRLWRGEAEPGHGAAVD